MALTDEVPTSSVTTIARSADAIFFVTTSSLERPQVALEVALDGSLVPVAMIRQQG